MQRLKIQQDPQTGALETSVEPVAASAQPADARQPSQDSGNDRRLAGTLDTDGRQRQELGV